MPQLEQLQYLISQLFWLAIIFALIYQFVGRFFIPRIGNIVETRRNQIKGDLLLAERLSNEHKELSHKIEEVLEKARKEGRDIKTNAAKNAEAEMHKKLSEFEKALSRKNASNEAKLARLESQLAGDIDKIAHGLSHEILNVILKSYSKTPN